MAKLKKEDFMAKYGEKLNEIDDIEMIEDLSDSLEYEDAEELQSIKVELEQALTELEQAKQDYLEIKEEYKQRFLSAVDSPEKEDEVEEIKEEEVVDIREI